MIRQTLIMPWPSQCGNGKCKRCGSINARNHYLVVDQTGHVQICTCLQCTMHYAKAVVF
ncbi:hypothetical protein B0T12DRAFT_203804 [Alternaria alternata]|nr:hypothetical protein B0T12DRAFT_203804 [Alternaria alternata]